MSPYRLYSGSDGVSRLEPLDFTRSPESTEPRAAKAINFNTHEVGWTVDLHPAPRRQVVFVDSGQLEIGLEDGTRQLSRLATSSWQMTRLVEATPPARTVTCRASWQRRRWRHLVIAKMAGNFAMVGQTKDPSETVERVFAATSSQTRSDHRSGF